MSLPKLRRIEWRFSSASSLRDVVGTGPTFFIDNKVYILFGKSILDFFWLFLSKIQ